MDFDAFRSAMGRRMCFDFGEAQKVVGLRRASLEVQLSRWCEAGKLMRLRKGLYAIGQAYRRVPLQGARAANIIVRPSYLTGLWALAYHDLLSEHGDEEEGHWRGEPCGVFTSATALGRACEFENELGRFRYYKLKPRLLFGAERRLVGDHWVWVATPEKAVLDYLFTTPRDWGMRRLIERGFYRTNSLDLEMLRYMALRYRSPRLAEIVGRLRMLARRERLFAARWLVPPTAAERAAGHEGGANDTREDVAAVLTAEIARISEAGDETRAHGLDNLAGLPEAVRGIVPVVERPEPGSEVVPAAEPAAPEYAVDLLSSEEFIVGGEARRLLGRPMARTIEGNWGRASAKKQLSWAVMSDAPVVAEYELPVWLTQRLWYHREMKRYCMDYCKIHELRPRWHRLKEWGRTTKRRHRADPRWVPEHDDFREFGLKYRFFPEDPAGAQAAPEAYFFYP